jgi:hypothetical protein
VRRLSALILASFVPLMHNPRPSLQNPGAISSHLQTERLCEEGFMADTVDQQAGARAQESECRLAGPFIEVTVRDTKRDVSRASCLGFARP